MNKTWPICIFIASFALLAIQKTHELNCLSLYFRSEKTPKLKSFQEARSKIKTQDLDLLKLWESILTGRSAPLSRYMKERYQKLGLNHLFTPSGFHLSAVLFPFLKFLKSINHRLIFLFLIGVALIFLPGLGALKRMLLIKLNQNIWGLHAGFIIAMYLDILFGTFQNSALSFTYSFLFLGIIYAGFKGILLSIWFFIGQILLAYFQDLDISPLLLFFSPILNFGFAILMPILFLLSFPLWDWQLSIGVFILRQLQWLVDQFALIIQKVPSLEINCVLLLIIFFIIIRRWKPVAVLFLFFCSGLNLDRQRNPNTSTNEFTPQSYVLKIAYDKKDIRVYFEDGTCRLRLIRGIWWESCSPRRRSNVRKKIKKLSYPS